VTKRQWHFNLSVQKRLLSCDTEAKIIMTRGTDHWGAKMKGIPGRDAKRRKTDIMN
jgi:hypothetical protein